MLLRHSSATAQVFTTESCLRRQVQQHLLLSLHLPLPWSLSPLPWWTQDSVQEQGQHNFFLFPFLSYTYSSSNWNTKGEDCLPHVAYVSILEQQSTGLYNKRVVFHTRQHVTGHTQCHSIPVYQETSFGVVQSLMWKESGYSGFHIN